MERIAIFIRDLSMNLGATKELLEDTQSKLGVEFPPDYAEFMITTNGAEGKIGPGYIALWSVEEIIPLNDAYEVDTFAPGLLLFGSDGGNTAYGFDTQSDSMPIIQVPFVGMNRDEIVICGQTFLDFLEYLWKES